MTKLVKIHLRCRNPTCLRFCLQTGDFPYCNTCSKRARYRGVLDVPALRVGHKRPYLKAARHFTKKPASRPSLAEIEVYLQSCRPWLRRQADFHRQGWGPKQRAKAVLAKIHQQRGPKAAALLLATCAGTAAMTMPHASQRYFKMQLAHSVFHLIKAEWFVWQGKRHKQRLRLQSRNLATALFELLRPLYFYWLEANRAAIIHRAATYKPLPPSQGATKRR
jgi:hypothetical protein